MNPISSSSGAVYRAVGARIRHERIERRLTQDALATAVSLKRTSITNIERGNQKLLVHTLVALAEALGVTASALLTPLEEVAPADLENKIPADLSPKAKNWVLAGMTTSARIGGNR